VLWNAEQMQVVIQIETVLEVTSEPENKHALKLNNKRRLHISKLHSLCEEKDKLKGLGAVTLDLIPIEGENNMLENVLLSRYYAIVDFISFACYPTTPLHQELAAKVVVL
jgi:hypothetical protein